MTANAYAFCIMLIFTAFLLGMKLGLTLRDNYEEKTNERSKRKLHADEDK